MSRVAVMSMAVITTIIITITTITAAIPVWREMVTDWYMVPETDS